MIVADINESNYNKAETFLGAIEGIRIDKDVMNNASLLLDGEDLIGVISFEVFGKLALIRYFVFKKVVDEENLKDLFNNLVHKAKEKNVSKILSFIHNEDATPIFEFLGFFPVDKKLVYIEERKFLNSKNKEAHVYCYEIS